MASRVWMPCMRPPVVHVGHGQLAHRAEPHCAERSKDAVARTAGAVDAQKCCSCCWVAGVLTAQAGGCAGVATVVVVPWCVAGGSERRMDAGSAGPPPPTSKPAAQVNPDPAARYAFDVGRGAGAQRVGETVPPPLDLQDLVYIENTMEIQRSPLRFMSVAAGQPSTSHKPVLRAHTQSHPDLRRDLRPPPRHARLAPRAPP